MKLENIIKNIPKEESELIANSFQLLEYHNVDTKEFFVYRKWYKDNYGSCLNTLSDYREATLKREQIINQKIRSDYLGK